SRRWARRLPSSSTTTRRAVRRSSSCIVIAPGILSVVVVAVTAADFGELIQAIRDAPVEGVGGEGAVRLTRSGNQPGQQTDGLIHAIDRIHPELPGAHRLDHIAAQH